MVANSLQKFTASANADAIDTSQPKCIQHVCIALADINKLLMSVEGGGMKSLLSATPARPQKIKSSSNILVIPSHAARGVLNS
jgi:hypothetical protein